MGAETVSTTVRRLGLAWTVCTGIKTCDVEEIIVAEIVVEEIGVDEG